MEKIRAFHQSYSIFSFVLPNAIFVDKSLYFVAINKSFNAVTCVLCAQLLFQYEIKVSEEEEEIMYYTICTSRN